MKPEEGKLYWVQRDGDSKPEVAQFRAGEFLFFGTDDNRYPDQVWIVAKVRFARAAGVRITADRIAAAKLRVKVGEKLNDPAPEWIRRLAKHEPGGAFGTDSQEIPDP